MTQSPLEGVSLVPTFDDPKAPEKHTTQYFEMMGHRSLYHDGWRAVCPWPGASFKESGRAFGTPITYDMLTQLDAKGWALYNVKEDFAETTNLAERERARVIAMIGMWYTEAGKYNLLPIDSRGLQRVGEVRPQIAVSRDRYVLYPGTQSIPAGAAPRILNRPYSITADVEAPGAGAEGVLLSFGDSDGGISFYVQNGMLCFAHNYVAVEYFYVKSKSAVPSGHHFLSVQFTPTGAPDFAKGKGSAGLVTLLVDGKQSGSGALAVTTPNRLAQGGAMLVGSDAGAAVTPEYKPPFRFTGEIKRVIVDVSGEHVEDYEAQMRIVLATQ
jgi:arylsulfatase